MMRDNLDGMPGIAISYGAILLVLSVFVLNILPREFAVVLVSWFTLSIPIGITLGHCVLNEP